MHSTGLFLKRQQSWLATNNMKKIFFFLHTETYLTVTDNACVSQMSTQMIAYIAGLVFYLLEPKWLARPSISYFNKLSWSRDTRAQGLRCVPNPVDLPHNNKDTNIMDLSFQPLNRGSGKGSLSSSQRMHTFEFAFCPTLSIIQKPYFQLSL